MAENKIKFLTDIIDSTGGSITSKNETYSTILDILQALHPKEIVVVPDTTTYISDTDYQQYESTAKVIYIPDSVTTLGNNAFANFKQLATIIIGSGLKNVYSGNLGILSKTPCLSNIKVDKNNPNMHVMSGCLYLRDNVNRDYLIRYAAARPDTTLDISTGVYSIYAYAFEGCHNLTKILVPSSVEHIGYGAFENCDALEQITLPFVGSRRDANSSSDKFCYIFGTTSEGLEQAKYVPSSLKEVIITDGTRVPGHAFENCNNIQKIILNEGITYIGTDAFNNCTNLTDITIPNSIKSVYSAFRGCDNLNYNEYNNINYLGNEENPYLVLYRPNIQYDALTSCEINENTKVIAESGFSSYYNLSSITIPQTITNIEYDAFSGCTRLKTVNISSLEEWYKIDFGLSSYSNPLKYGADLYVNGELIQKDTFKLPDNLTSLSACAFVGDWRKLDNNVYYIDTWAADTTSKDIVLREGTIGICDDAFWDSRITINSIILPESLKYIGKNAFYGNHLLTDITITKNVEKIGNSAFNQCGVLANVTFAEGSKLKEIGDNAFYYCKELTSISLPNGLTRIGDDVFAACYKLTNMVIPASVTYIGLNGLGVDNRCNIKYRGTEDQWKAIEFGSGLDYSKYNITYNYTGN
jgi:hypothetical protein